MQEQLELSLAGKASEQYFIGVVDKHRKPDDDAIYQKVLKGLWEELKQGVQNNQQYKETLSALSNLTLRVTVLIGNYYIKVKLSNVFLCLPIHLHKNAFGCQQHHVQ